MAGDEEDLWHQVTQGVDPIKARKKRVTRKIADLPKKADRTLLHPVMIPPPVESTQRAAASLQSGDIRDVDGGTAQKLKSGKYPIDAVIDLHGKTQQEAFAILQRSVVSAYQQGRRCLLVITGKGKPVGEGVLRSNLPDWLNLEGLREYVVMFTKAAPKDGGSGAFYVLLKRRR